MLKQKSHGGKKKKKKLETAINPWNGDLYLQNTETDSTYNFVQLIVPWFMKNYESF